MRILCVFLTLAGLAGSLCGQQPAQTQPRAHVEASPGDDIGGGARACRKGDDSPAGTLKDGWKKVLILTPMGNGCHWERANTEADPRAEASPAAVSGSPKAQQSQARVEASPGNDIGGGARACRKGDDSPAGTLKDGWKKVLISTPMSNGCHWERASTEADTRAEASRAAVSGSPGAQQPQAQVEASPGDDIGGGVRACRKGDDSPAGTQKDGWKKVLLSTPMGSTCRWERAN